VAWAHNAGPPRGFFRKHLERECPPPGSRENALRPVITEPRALPACHREAGGLARAQRRVPTRARLRPRRGIATHAPAAQYGARDGDAKNLSWLVSSDYMRLHEPGDFREINLRRLLAYSRRSAGVS